MAFLFPDPFTEPLPWTDEDGKQWDADAQGRWFDYVAPQVTNLSATASPTTVTVHSSSGTDATIPASNGTNAGLMVPAQFDKLEALSGSGAWDDITGKPAAVTALSGTNTGDQTNIAGNAATVTTNANLTGHVTSVGNATLLGSFTISQLNTAVSDADVLTTATAATTYAPKAGPVFTGTASFDGIHSTGTALFNDVSVDGPLYANAGVIGDGSQLTTINGSNITTGTIPAARLTNAAPIRRLLTGAGPHTAAIGDRITLDNTSGVARIDDPTGTSAGQMYTVIIQRGTMWFNGTGQVFAASRLELVRAYNGATWSTLGSVVSDTLTVGALTSSGAISGTTGTFSGAVSSGAVLLSTGTTTYDATLAIYPAARFSANGYSDAVVVGQGPNGQGQIRLKSANPLTINATTGLSSAGFVDFATARATFTNSSGDGLGSLRAKARAGHTVNVFDVVNSADTTVFGVTKEGNLTASGTVTAEAISGTTGTFSGVVSVIAGTAAATSIRHPSAAGTGLYFPFSSQIAFAISGSQTLIHGSGYVQIPSNATATTFLLGASGDVAFSRISSGVAGIATSFAGGSGGSLNLTNLTASGTVTAARYIEGVTALGTVGATAALTTITTSVITATLTNSIPCTFAMPTPAAGLAVVIHLKQASATPTTATFTGVVWSGGVAPTITATAGKVDIFSFIAGPNAAGSGTVWYGSALQNLTPP